MICPLCKKREANTRDHIIPKAVGGTLSDENIHMICSECNQLKNLLIDRLLIRMYRRLYEDSILKRIFRNDGDSKFKKLFYYYVKPDGKERKRKIKKIKKKPVEGKNTKYWIDEEMIYDLGNKGVVRLSRDCVLGVMWPNRNRDDRDFWGDGVGFCHTFAEGKVL